MNEQARPSSAELRRARRQARLVTFQDFAASAPAPTGPAGKGGPPHFPPFLQLFRKTQLAFAHFFFAFFPILDVSGRVSDAQNHGSMDSSIMDLANEYLISPLAISSSPLWRFQRKSILGQLLKKIVPKMGVPPCRRMSMYDGPLHSDLMCFIGISGKLDESN